ncbi:Protein of unknown function [Pseudovibrio ascidiaceicola]|uniref:Lysozyme inhibitor LprI-like N-terminal domain-containing protein n=1 Tax=Pseudovibrio ascidiaceicola TaxID=285279 RepID=A0A1I4ARY5_9HYPH|nr:lysozyme inhibitor LprI family protein [Pseudovibrio ascidiaceicola]SFK58416.1 Protein of unknown function [Pseudovibrio ascidiaceicola]
MRILADSLKELGLSSIAILFFISLLGVLIFLFSGSIRELVLSKLFTSKSKKISGEIDKYVSIIDECNSHLEIAEKRNLDPDYHRHVKQKLDDAVECYLKLETQKDLISGDAPDFTTQSEMNEYAYDLLWQTQKELAGLIEELLSLPDLSAQEIEAFNASQRSWETFSDQQAVFSSLVAEGGTMQPCLWASDKYDKSLERIADLKQELKTRKSF